MKLHRIALWIAFVVLCAAPVAATDLTIDQLNAVGSMASGDEFPIWHSGATYKATGSQLQTLLCGGTCGTVTSVTAGTNIVVTGGGTTTPTVSTTAAPSFGQVSQTGENMSTGWLEYGTLGTASTNVLVFGNGAVASTSYTRIDAAGNSCGTISGVVLNVRATTSNVLCVDANGNLQINGSGQIYYGSGANFSGLSATKPVCTDGSENLTSTCSSAASSFGATTVPSLTDSGLTSGDCVQASTGGLLANTANSCVVTGATASLAGLTVTGLSATSVVCTNGSEALTSTCTSATPSFGSTTVSGLIDSALSTSSVVCSSLATALTSTCSTANPTFAGLTLSGLSATTVVCTTGAEALTSTCSSATPTFGSTTVSALNDTGLTASRCAATDGSKNLTSAAANCRQFPVTCFQSFTNTALTASTATTVGSACAPALGTSTGANGNWLVTVTLYVTMTSGAAGGTCAITSASAGTQQGTTYYNAAGTHAGTITNTLADNNNNTGTTNSAVATPVVYVATYSNSTTPSFQAYCYTTSSSKVASGYMSVNAEPN